MTSRGRLGALALLSGLAGLAACGARPGDGATAASAAPQLCVIRHGQAFRNLIRLTPATTADALDHLTPQGKDEARRAGERLPPGAAAVYASPARRTRQTAALLGRGGEALVASELRSLEGALSFGERQIAWQRGEDPRPADGERLADGLARVQSLLRRVRTEVPAEAHVVLVTHGDIGPLVIGELEGIPPLERPFRVTLETGQGVCLPRPR